MARIVCGSLFLVLSLSAAAAEDKGREKPATPAEQYQAIIKEYQLAGSVKTRSDEERRQASPTPRPSTPPWRSSSRRRKRTGRNRRSDSRGRGRLSGGPHRVFPICVIRVIRG